MKALLGNDFPKEEIDAIIKEADLTKDGKISYSEFLALWEDKNETRHRESISQIRALADTYHSDRSSVISDHTSEDEGAEVAARANFLEGKRLSERKVSAKVEAAESEHKEAEGDKHVGFKDDVSTIPSVAYEEEGSTATVQLKHQASL